MKHEVKIMKIMERGQVTIPKKLREKYGIYKNTEVDFVPEKDGLLLKKRKAAPGRHREVFGILKKNTSTDSYIEKIRGR
jgi:AbrB family looped-hinge helix DNA binding protein